MCEQTWNEKVASPFLCTLFRLCMDKSCGMTNSTCETGTFAMQDLRFPEKLPLAIDASLTGLWQRDVQTVNKYFASLSTEVRVLLALCWRVEKPKIVHSLPSEQRQAQTIAISFPLLAVCSLIFLSFFLLLLLWLLLLWLLLLLLLSEMHQ